MKEIDCIEGRQAQQNFEEGMKALFKVSKDEVVKAENRKKRQRASGFESQRTLKRSDKD